MRTRLVRLLPLIAAALVTQACINPPYQEPFQASRVDPGPGQELKVDQVLVIFDASGSIDPENDFPAEKALLESFVQGMPQGDYLAGLLAFGGERRQSADVGGFGRERLAETARAVRYLGEDTPLPEVLADARSSLGSRSGRAAVVLFSDGLPTASGRPVQNERALEAARELVAQHGGQVCFHTVQTGSEDGGEELLQELTGLTDCGSFRRFAAVDEPSRLAEFQRTVFLGRALPPVAAAPPKKELAPPDRDGDGIPDVDDACPGTPTGANVNSRGCWALQDLRFASDSYDLQSLDLQEIEDVARVLQENPDLEIAIEGHTDATGSESYNMTLSRQRAEAVRDALVVRGIDADRLSTRAVGEAQPLASNQTAAGRAKNRRIEFKLQR